MLSRYLGERLKLNQSYLTRSRLGTSMLEGCCEGGEEVTFFLVEILFVVVVSLSSLFSFLGGEVRAAASGVGVVVVVGVEVAMEGT